jgi:hypothetical protein
MINEKEDFLGSFSALLVLDCQSCNKFYHLKKSNNII